MNSSGLLVDFLLEVKPRGSSSSHFRSHRAGDGGVPTAVTRKLRAASGGNPLLAGAGHKETPCLVAVTISC